MAKKIRIFFIAAILLIAAACCISSIEKQKRDYGTLGSTVTYASDKVIGEYGCNIPDDFDAANLLSIVKKEVSESRYRLLKKYRLEVIPHRTYYLLKVYDGQRLIMFDYSCTIKLDGPILFSSVRFDLDHLEKYDECAKDKQRN